MIKKETIEMLENAQDKQCKIRVVHHFRKFITDKHALKLLCVTAKRVKTKILKSIEEDLRNSEKDKLPLTW